MNNRLSAWVGKSIARRLALPAAMLLLLMLVQAAASGGFASLMVSRLESAVEQSGRGLRLTERLLQATSELARHARSSANEPDPALRAAAISEFNRANRELGLVVDEISGRLSRQPALQQAVSEGVSSFVISGVKATRLADRGRLEDAQRELQQNFEPRLLEYVITTVSTLNKTSAADLADVHASGTREFRIALVTTLVVVLLTVAGLLHNLLQVRRRIVTPVAEAATTARRLAAGDYAPVPAVPGGDECAELARAMGDLSQQLQERQRDAVAAFRVRSGLDLASSCVIIADSADAVIYANEAALALMRQALPGRDVRGARLQDLLEAAAGAEALHGNPRARRLRFGELVVDVVDAQIISDDGTSIGRVTEWTDRTVEIRAQREVASVIQGAGEGDFSRRVPVADKSGYWFELAGAVNRLTETFDEALQEISGELKALSEGRLADAPQRTHSGLLGQVFEDLSRSRAQLAAMVSQISEAAEAVGTAVEGIRRGNDSLLENGAALADSIARTGETVRAVSEAVRRTATRANELHGLAASAQGAADRGGEAVASVVRAMSEVSDYSSKVVDVVAVIDGLAFQTNLLALNAAVEAARAGEAGRGFAVVAAEVRALSQRCTGSAREIKALIEGSDRAVRSGSKLVSDAGGTINDVLAQVESMTRLVAEIRRDAGEQQQGIEAVAQTFQQVEHAQDANDALIERTGHSSATLEQLAGQLSGAVGRFVLEGAAGRAGRSAAGTVVAAASGLQRTEVAAAG